MLVAKLRLSSVRVPLDPKITLIDTEQAIALFNRLTQDRDFKDAFLGVKLQDEGWIKASDTEQQSYIVDKVTASIPPFEERLLAEDGVA